MASVHLDFPPPEREGFVKLHIYEAPSEEMAPGPIIETVEEIGEWPNYISSYSTNLATAVNKWFSIAWEDDKGVLTDISAPVQGGTESLVGVIVSRVLLRDSQVNELVATQSAEFVIEEWFSDESTTVDPYEVDPQQTFKTLEGLTLLTLARSLISSIVSSSNTESYTAGLVSQKSGSGTRDNRDLIAYLLRESAILLGVPQSVVMSLADVDPTGLGNQSSINYDQTRLALTVNFE